MVSSENRSATRQALIGKLKEIVGKRHVLTNARSTRSFRTGYRYGGGKILAVVRPGTLVEQWRAFCAAVEADVVVIVQAANTGLTGGSTPFGNDYDREVVVINTLRIDRIDFIGDGHQVLCLAGSTLHRLQEKLAHIGRDPHSVIGSTTIGASVIGGICNNSGGALIHRGPAFTQMALFARVDEDGTVRLVNHLGIELGDSAEEILCRLDRGDYGVKDVELDSAKLASDPDYEGLIRDVDATSPARFNNDQRLLYEASGSAGKLCVFAVRLDTFAKPDSSKVFYVGSNDYLELTRLRRHVLTSFVNLPVAAEYLHRSAYDLAEIYGKDIYIFLKLFGSARISTAFKLKSWLDGLTDRLGLGYNVSDKFLQLIVGLLPNHLPERMNTFRSTYEHHLLLRTAGAGIEEMRSCLSSMMPSRTGDFFECDDDEADAALRHRYAVGGACVRYRAVQSSVVGDVVALDVALPRNAEDWRETVPPEVEEHIEKRSIYGHFFCHVFHYDYAVKKGVDWLTVEHRLVRDLEQRGVELPSEHNVGHLYLAKPNLAEFYRSLDPTNTLNPGIGQTSKRKHWA